MESSEHDLHRASASSLPKCLNCRFKRSNTAMATRVCTVSVFRLSLALLLLLL